MFALPLNPSLPSTLASHVFGRFASAPRPAAAVAAMGSTAPERLAAAPVVDAFEDEEEFDLAQRVREVGEW